MEPKPAVEHLSLHVIGLMCVLPFLAPHHRLPIPGFYGELTAFALGMLAMCTFWQKAVLASFQLPRITLLPFGILCIILLQTALGMIAYPQQALLGMLYLLWACLLMALGYHLRGALGWEKLATTLAWFLVAGGLLNTVMTGLQYAGVKTIWLLPKIAVQSFGNLGQPNHFANYMALATASLAYLLARNALPRLAFPVLATGFLAALALSGSRSGWLYLAAFFILAIIRSRRVAAAENRRLILACLALLPMFAAIQSLLHWLLPLWNSTPHLLPTEHFFQQVNSASIRWRLWRDALHMLMEQPWLGVGHGQFAWNSFLLASTHAAGEFSNPAEHAHNLLLNLLAEQGIFAGLLLIGLGWIWIKQATAEKLTLERWWMWAMLAVLGIHSMLEYPLWYSYFLGIAAILLGAGETRVLRPDLSRIGRPALAAMLGLGFCSMIALAQSYGTLEHWVTRAMSHTLKDSELPAFNQAMLSLHRKSLLTPYVELIYAISLPANRENLDDKLAITGKALRFAPGSTVAYQYAELLAQHGDLAGARQQLALTRSAYPNDMPRHREKLIAAGLDPGP